MSTDFKTGEAALAAQTQLTAEEKQLAELLVANGQAHIFSGWGPTGQDDAKKSALLAQVADFQTAYPGGVEAYCSKAKSLLKQSLSGANPYQGYAVSAPTSSVCIDDSNNDTYEALGMSQIGQTAFVLVAGGLGERLGYNGIKIELPWETASMKCFLAHYIEHILTYQAEARKTSPNVVIQLGIMTSDDTNALTVRLLEANNYFGAEESQITVFKQGLVPALADNNATFVVGSDGLLTAKPHGHGDVHMLLYQQGIVAGWQKQHGIKWLVFFQDTNGLIFRAIPAAVGVAIEQKLIMNYICSTRKQGDAVGAICTLTRTDTTGDMSLPDALTINVEYNQITGLLGDQPEPETKEGFSVYPGNTNSLVFAVDAYLEVLAKTEGVIKEFVNPKYANKEKTVFKKPTRLECMMQDFPKLLTTEDAQRVGFASFAKWTAFSAVKNDVASAAAKQTAGNNPECASSGECSNYNFAYTVLASAGVEFTGDVKSASFGGVSNAMQAKISISPSVGSTKAQIKSKFTPKGSGITITNSSVLAVDGSAISVESLNLDGALIIKAVEGASVVVRDLSVSNAGWTWVPLQDGESYEEYLRIRAFTVAKAATEEYVFSTPGTYVLSDSTKAGFNSAL